jgi:hypothetical protein
MSSLICTPHQILFGRSNQEDKMGGTSSIYEGREESHTGFWWGNMRERDHFEDLGVDVTIILKQIFKKWDAAMDLP